MKVFVYYNLHLHCWSIKDLKTGLVIEHTHLLWLKDVTFKVSEAGRQRVLREKKKNVHAGVVGVRCEETEVHAAVNIPVTYNPYFMGCFTRKDTGEPIYRADYVELCSTAPDKVLASM